MKGIIWGLILLSVQICRACSCEEADSVETAYERASAVVLGRVIGLQIEPDEKDSLFEHLICTLEIFDVFKGDSFVRTEQKRRLIDIRTGMGGGDCGVRFSLGDIVLVYAFGNTQLSTSICTRTSSFTGVATEDVNTLEKLAKKSGSKPDGVPSAKSSTATKQPTE